jgi:hypothetical protein
MFLIQYWATIFYHWIHKKWGKLLKAKKLREEEMKLELTIKKWLKIRREKEALEGVLKADRVYLLVDPASDLYHSPEVAKNAKSAQLKESEEDH